ncbi:MAG: beta-ketoacyl-[acyl-carrier-protein] synthase family protein [Bryobacteraceae bacterium]
MNRVAVTGVGVVCALGNDATEFAAHLFAGECGIRPLTDPGLPPYKFGAGAEARTFRPCEHFSEKDLTLIERFVQFAAVAAREAVAESGLRFEGELNDRTAVVTGTGVGGKISEQEGYRRLYQNGDSRVAPLTIPKTMTNAGASRISLEFGIQGPTYTVATACSSSNHAIGQAFWMVRSGIVDVAVAGGSEAVFVDGLLRAWEAMRVVSPDVCRPFSAHRRGLSLGEGGAMLVLENWEHARARGANIRAEVLGFGMSSDAHHITQPRVEGLAKAMKWALRDARIDAGQVGHINAHGTGTQANDAAEASAIRSVFGNHVDEVLVTSTKSMHGHTLGAAGAIEGVATLLALENGAVPPTVNCIELDPECGLNVVTGNTRAAAFPIALSNTFAFGGLNACLVLARRA